MHPIDEVVRTIAVPAVRPFGYVRKDRTLRLVDEVGNTALFEFHLEGERYDGLVRFVVNHGIATAARLARNDERSPGSAGKRADSSPMMYARLMTPPLTHYADGTSPQTWPAWAIREDRRDAFAVAFFDAMNRAAGVLSELLADGDALLAALDEQGRDRRLITTKSPADPVFTLISYGRYEEALDAVDSLGLEGEGAPFLPGWFEQFIQRWKQNGERRSPGTWSADQRRDRGSRT